MTKVNSRLRKPTWLKVKANFDENYGRMKNLLNQSRLHTVCQEASCPNISECFSQKTATFMILGRVCTRSCVFCDVEKGMPKKLDPDEPARLAELAARLGLEYVVITSVTRDDLEDGGASVFAETVAKIRAASPKTKVEVLIPDFKGSLEALSTVMRSRPQVLNHNLETVRRLYPEIRPEAGYHKSLDLLRHAKKMDRDMITKSGLMVGLGETREETIQSMRDLRKVGCDLLTIGQYLTPPSSSYPVKKYYHPREFQELKKAGEDLGFKNVEAAPLVRSSYRARAQLGGLSRNG